MSSIAVSVENLSKSYNEKELFDEITFGIDQGQKVALVGINGCGKSTLLNVISGKESPDSGIVSFQKDVRVSYLDQSPDLSEFSTVMDSVLDSSHPEASLLKEYWALVELGEPSEEAQQQLHKLIERIDALGAWDYEYRLKEVLGKLGINDLDIQIKNLSGGQQKRIALAKALLDQPDFLILDEPTNHLDLEIIEWLEDYLAAQNLSILMVTHDRYFLDKVCNEIIEIDQGRIFRYKGNYAHYLEKKEEALEMKKAGMDKARNLLSKELEWMRRQPKARGTKAKYRIDAFYETKEKTQASVSRDELDIKIGGKRQGKKILELEKIGKSFDEHILFKDFEHVFTRGEKVGIVGKNGTGKSTFLNVLTGELEPDQGEINVGINTTFGYYRQESLNEPEGKTVIDAIKEVAEVIKLVDGSVVTASQLLNQFLFPPKVQHSHISKLSGGERRRLQLLKVLMANPNFLILDEPTNDLDIITLNILEDYLENFEGCLLIVSHDRYFMDRLVDHLFVFNSSVTITDFPGNYTDFRQSDLSQVDQPESSTKKESNKTRVDDNKKLSYKEQREFQSLEGEIEKLGNKKKELELMLNSGETDHEKLTGWSTKLQRVQSCLDEKEMRWLELSEYE